MKQIAKVINHAKIEAVLPKLRQHQKDALAHAKRIVAGMEKDKTTTCYVTPGGGKTLMAAYFAGVLLDAGHIDEVIAICPRDTLRSQFVRGVYNRDFGVELILGAEGNKKINQLPLGARHGIVATIQSISRAPERYIKRLKGKRYLVIVDEAHHVKDDAAWERYIKPIINGAAHVLLMSGTLYRGDGLPIPFVHYDEDLNAKIHIQYDRRTAQNEGAVRIVEAMLLDGDYQFEHRHKTHAGVISEAATKLKIRGAIKSAVRCDDFRFEMIESAVRHWKEYRDSTGYKSRMIVLADEQVRAVEIVDHIRRKGLDAILAISDDGDKAKRALSAFRDKKDGDILVTVGMAYEGFDCPDCTHLVCLTRIRCWPWLEQAFARVMRIDQDAPVQSSQQRAFICTIGDLETREFFQKFLEEQQATFDPKASRESDGGIAPKKRGDFIRVIDAEQNNGSTIYTSDIGHLSSFEQWMVEQILKEFPDTKAWPASKRLDLAKRVYAPREAV